MAEDTALFGPSDLQAAVAAGIVTEAQAASLRALALDRAGRRAALPSEDEPFEFFRGFSEIFVSVGLVILLSGIGLFLSWFGGIGVLILVPAITAGIAWWWAGYFTLRRRMNLPSMVLALAYGGGVGQSAAALFVQAGASPRLVIVGSALVSLAAMALWYRRFRLPFAMFVLGLSGLIALYGMTASIDATLGFYDRGFFAGLFDLRTSPSFALSSLVFGIAAFIGGMWFDTKDPYRMGRHSATAFWLHLLAAPALVNTVALTLYNIGGTAGMLATAAALVLIAILALVIDRRSFLTAGIVYVALILAWVIRDEGGDGFGRFVAILIILGAFVTATGTWWTQLRGSLMRVLPDFPGKNLLPPYAVTR